MPTKAKALNSCSQADGICISNCVTAMNACINVCNQNPPWNMGPPPSGFSTPTAYGQCVNACENQINSCNAACQAEYCN
jgi:hypothetical protein